MRLLFVLLIVNCRLLAGTLYTVDESTNRLYSFSSTAPSGLNLLGTLTGPGSSITGLAYDTFNQRLVGSNSSALFAIDPVALTTTLIESFSLNTGRTGLEYVASENAFYVTSAYTDLYRIVLSSTVTFVASLPVPVVGMAYDPGSNTLLGLSTGGYYSINRSTGVLTSLFAAPAFNDAGLAFDTEQGMLWTRIQAQGVYFRAHPGGPDVLAFSDSTNTHSLAFVPDGVPEPATSALTAGALLTLFAFVIRKPTA